MREVPIYLFVEVHILKYQLNYEGSPYLSICGGTHIEGLLWWLTW